MSGKYNFENAQVQAGAIGDAADVTGNVFNQGAGLDLPKLAEELTLLRSAMLAESTEPEQIAATGQVAAAEVEAKKGNESGVLQALKGAGQWALKIAGDIGTKLALEALKKAMGLP